MGKKKRKKSKEENVKEAELLDLSEVEVAIKKYFPIASVKEIANQVCETSLPVHKLNNKKILVTGCNGFIPSAFIKILNQMFI